MNYNLLQLPHIRFCRATGCRETAREAYQKRFTFFNSEGPLRGSDHFTPSRWNPQPVFFPLHRDDDDDDGGGTPPTPPFFLLFATRIPLVPNGRNSRFDGIFFSLRKRPGGSASNRVFSLSVLKKKLFRGDEFLARASVMMSHQSPR
jgi:hypothetical protein